MKNNIVYSVGELCKDIRQHIVRITQKEMSEITGVNSSTLSAFENGRSTNMKLLFSYLNMLPNEDKLKYLQDIINIIEKKVINMVKKTIKINSLPEDNTKAKMVGEEIKRIKKEVSRKSAIAKKRIQRLEKNELTDSPAYRNLFENGDPNFSVRNKTYNELQAELSQLNTFLNAKTSTIRGINKVLKETASNIGMKYKKVSDLKTQVGTFFELINRLEQYNKSVQASAKAMGYQKLWKIVNEFIEKENLDISQSEFDMEYAIQKLSELTIEQYGASIPEDDIFSYFENI